MLYEQTPLPSTNIHMYMAIRASASPTRCRPSTSEGGKVLALTGSVLQPQWTAHLLHMVVPVLELLHLDMLDMCVL